MTRRLRPVVEDADEERRAALAHWRRPGQTGLPDPDAVHVGDPDGPALVRGRPAGMAADPLPEGSEYVRGDGAWRDRPGMREWLAFLRRERERLGIPPGETEPPSSASGVGPRA